MIPEHVTFLTKEGLQKLEHDLHVLCTVRRPQVIKQLQDALEQTSALENLDYEVAKNEQAFIEGHILQLEQILRNVVIIEKHESNGVIELGSQVTITEGVDGELEKYVLVGSAEADPRRGYISNKSPLGRALIGRQVGDRVVIQAPDGEIEFYIKSID